MPVKPIRIYLEHFRCFAEGQSIPIRPLTLLVGENSSGKSTFLAAAACIFDRERFPSRPGLNEPPFNLGTFDTIATFKGGKYGRDESFTIGYTAGEAGNPHYQDMKATYGRVHGAPGLQRFEGRIEEGRITLLFGPEGLKGEVILTPSKEFPEEITLAVSEFPYAQNLVSQSFSLNVLASLFFASFGRKEWGIATSNSEMDQIQRVARMSDSFQPTSFGSVVPFAPIRTKPRRTYDEFSEDYSAEGDHVPKILARLLNEQPTTGTARQLQDSLRRFGAESRLFREISVKKLGQGPEDPFQVQVSLGGPRVNLVDVGYGVSQVLPVLVQSAIRRENSLLLLQQPEVHLHPRAQAALGTFFAELVAIGRDTLLVETHSDFLVDRVRQEVAKGTLKPEQVQILFFHRPKSETTVYPIDLDEQGNVTNAPEHYRDFFLDEQLSLLRRGRS